MQKEKKARWGFIIFLLIVIVVLGSIFAGIVSLLMGSGPNTSTGNIAVIPISGFISTGSGSAFGSGYISSEEVISLIDEANKNPNVKAIIFEVDSPGGAGIAPSEIADAIRSTDKMTVAVIQDIATSGGYWAISSSDYIIANRLSMTGAIGVLASYIDFSGLLSDYNITYQRFVGGKYKDLGSPFKEPTKEESELLQSKIDKMHGYFIEAIAENRNLPEGKVRDMATGMFYLGEEAKELGLVDAIGGKKEAIEIIEQELDITASLSKYEHKKSLFSALTSMSNENLFWLGKGIGSNFASKEIISWS